MNLPTIPPLPGAIIRDRILNGTKLRQADLARAMGVSTVRLNHIVNGKAPITASMALRLGHATGTKAEYWMRLQTDFELFEAGKRLMPVLNTLPKLVDRRSEAAPDRPPSACAEIIGIAQRQSVNARDDKEMTPSRVAKSD